MRKSQLRFLLRFCTPFGSVTSGLRLPISACWRRGPRSYFRSINQPEISSLNIILLRIFKLVGKNATSCFTLVLSMEKEH